MEVNEVENELKHWGILGMKWGIRNYQNPDGSLTPEGRIRYGVGPARSTGALLKGINDAGSLSDEELRKMSRRYKAQADYLTNMNEFLKQERYMKQQVTPERKQRGPSAIGTFAKKVFGEPLQNFLAENVKFGLGALGYNVLKGENADIASQYLNSVTGLNMHYKTKEEREKDAMQKQYDLLKLQKAKLEYMNEFDKHSNSKSERERKEQNDEINLEKNKLELEKLRKTIDNMDNDDSRYMRNKDAKLEADYITSLNKMTKNMRPIYNKMYDKDANQFIYSYFSELAENPIYKDLNFNNNVPVELKNATDKWGFTYKELLDIYGLE